MWVKKVQAEEDKPGQALGPATCRRKSEEGEAGRLAERRLRESSHWSTKNRREGSGSGYKIQDGEKNQRKR